MNRLWFVKLLPLVLVVTMLMACSPAEKWADPIYAGDIYSDGELLTTDHAQLKNLDYAASGHTGIVPEAAFASSASAIPYQTGDYAADWSTITLPSGANGMLVLAYNSNAGANRLYLYTNGAWHYIEVT